MELFQSDNDIIIHSCLVLFRSTDADTCSSCCVVQPYFSKADHFPNRRILRKEHNAYFMCLRNCRECVVCGCFNVEIWMGLK